MLDIKKVTKTPKDQWQAIDALVKTEQHLLTAINLLDSIRNYHDEEYWEIHKKNIEKFLSQFETQ